MKRHEVLIVGGGHAGAQAAIALRQLGFTGSIAIVNAEPEPPYERPPLSKDYLAGDKMFERMLIRPLGFWEERQVDLLLGREVAMVDAQARIVSLGDGETLGYGSLIWAAGGAARRLECEGGALPHLYSIRCRADVDRMLDALPKARRVAVIGGGYIGLEAAAVLTGLGKQVVLLEAMDRVLARVAGEPVSRFYESEHRASGVDVRTDVTVESVTGESVRIAGGGEIPADLVVVGIGIVPAVAPLLAAGAKGSNGVDVDEQCRTSLAGIYAVGDCAAHPNRFAGGARVRIESVQNATDQATTAARAIAGQPQDYDAIPWFWSNQYALKLQTVGLSIGHDDLVVRGTPGSDGFSVVYLKEGRVIALDCVNAVRDYAQGRRLILDGAMPDKALLADPAIPLKTLAG